MNYVNFEQVKEKVDLLDLARKNGIEVNNNRAKCVFHHDANPSLTFYPDTNSFYCFGCGKGGSVVEFYAELKHCSSCEAVRQLAAENNLRFDCTENADLKRCIDKYAAKQQQLTICVNNWQKQLTREHVEHLIKRGLTVDLIAELQIGYAGDDSYLDQAKREVLGLVSENGYYLPTGSIVIPFKTFGNISFLVFYRPGKDPKYLYPRGWSKPLIGADRMTKCEEVYLTEGVFDYISLMTIGVPALCAFGTNLSKEQKKELLRVQKKVFIAFDADEAGQKAALALAREFYPKARILKLPDSNDLNELLLSEKERFAARLENMRAFSKDIIDFEMVAYKKLQEWERTEYLHTSIIPLLTKIPATELRSYYDQNKKCLGISSLKVFEGMIKDSGNLLKIKEREAREENPLTDEERLEAEELLRSPAFLDRFIKTTEQLHHVGEDDNKKYLYLAMTSRKLDRPISTLVKGESSAGKSYLVETVSSFFPKGELLSYTRLTPNVLYYSKKSYSHKMLIIMEHNGSEESDYPIRSLISEGNLRISTTAKDGAGNFIEADHEVEGPIGYIETTTRPTINNENETRVFDIYIDESEAQTKRILAEERVRAQQGNIGRDKKSSLLRPFINAQRILASYKVIIPYSTHITFPGHKVRSRRDFKRFLSLIEASALLQQLNRKKEQKDGETYLVAEIDDYEVAYKIASKILSQTLKDISPYGEYVAEVAYKLAEKRTINQALTRKDFYEAIPEKSTSSIDRYLNELVNAGVFEQEGGGKGRGNAITYLILKKLDQIDMLIPSPEEIRKIMIEQSPAA